MIAANLQRIDCVGGVRAKINAPLQMPKPHQTPASAVRNASLQSGRWRPPPLEIPFPGVLWLWGGPAPDYRPHAAKRQNIKKPYVDIFVSMYYSQVSIHRFSILIFHIFHIQIFCHQKIVSVDQNILFFVVRKVGWHDFWKMKQKNWHFLGLTFQNRVYNKIWPFFGGIALETIMFVNNIPETASRIFWTCFGW